MKTEKENSNDAIRKHKEAHLYRHELETFCFALQYAEDLKDWLHNITMDGLWCDISVTGKQFLWTKWQYEDILWYNNEPYGNDGRNKVCDNQ